MPDRSGLTQSGRPGSLHAHLASNRGEYVAAAPARTPVGPMTRVRQEAYAISNFPWSEVITSLFFRVKESSSRIKKLRQQTNALHAKANTDTAVRAPRAVDRDAYMIHFGKANVRSGYPLDSSRVRVL